MLAALAACNSNNKAENQTNTASSQEEQHDKIFYASLNRAIHQGQYDGTMSVEELKKHGNLGVGSAARLAYELVLLDGTAYGIPADGKVYELADTVQIPFAAVKLFNPDQTITIVKPLTLEALEAYLDSVITKNAFAALKVTGRFASLKYRSFEPQQRPYQPTDDVPEETFERSGIEATLVGLFTPESAEVLNSPVYHFHFVDEARTTGGHVNDLVVEQVEVQIDYANGLEVQLPDPALLQHLELNKPISE
ncbi:acetolactate decarboxylase [Pontibacter sp. SGAir0037]|uniref:acetolactate decarboxylase n=1 Tax=Pontibacter sp. SGAir0037 TaxID=2571030 RepID=UPI00143D842F|nr:acetolactate decarboxylase [Pontibacter sp. SGAir0037]